MNILVLLAVAAAFALLRYRRAGLLLWTAAWWVGIYLLLRFGFTAPIPGSVISLYMGIVTIAIQPHPFYRRVGNDIRMDLPVTLKEAVLGAKVKVPTPEGPVMLTVPKGSTSGKVLRLKGRGFTDKNGKRGDQLVSLEVDLPADDAELRSFAESWSGGGNPSAALGV